MGRTWELTSTEELLMLTMRDRHAYGLQIIEEVSRASEGTCQINIGTLYPALKRLQKRGLIEEKEVQEDLGKRNGHARRNYRVTPLGESFLCRIDAMREYLKNRPMCEPT